MTNIVSSSDPLLQSFELYRSGDTVSARNTYAAIYGALHLMKDV